MAVRIGGKRRINVGIGKRRGETGEGDEERIDREVCETATFVQ